MTTATAKKTALENKYLRNCDYSRLSHLVRILQFAKVSYNWTDVRAVELDTEN